MAAGSAITPEMIDAATLEGRAASASYRAEIERFEVLAHRSVFVSPDASFNESALLEHKKNLRDLAEKAFERGFKAALGYSTPCGV